MLESGVYQLDRLDGDAAVEHTALQLFLLHPLETTPHLQTATLFQHLRHFLFGRRRILILFTLYLLVVILLGHGVVSHFHGELLFGGH